jgi:phosphatidylinositol N-acetylglucosaminyltransferase subunit C
MTAPSSPSAPPPSVTSPRPLSPVPPPVPVETHPNRGALKRPNTARTPSESGFLAPEDAYKTYSPPRLRPLPEVKYGGVTSLNGTLHTSQAASAAAAALRPAVASLRPPPAIPISARLEQDKKRRSASRKSHQPRGWKKLLWIHQPCMATNALYGLVTNAYA